MKHLHRFQKFMAAVMVFTMLFGSVPAWATGEDISIASNGTVTPNTWSNTTYVGVDGKVATIGTGVINSIKTNQPTTTHVYGIKYEGTGTLSVGSLAGGINFDSNSSAYGIYANNTGKTKVSEVGGITAKGAAYGYGIYSKGTGAGFENNVSFVSGSTINASGNNSGGRGIHAEGKGKTYVTNLGGITSNSSNASAYGIYSCGSDTSFANNVSFSGTDSTITATGSGKQNYGIATYGTGTTTVSGLGGIYANTSFDGDNTAYGIYSNGSDASLVTNVTFADGGKIRATSPLTTSLSKNAYGICTENNGTTTVSNLSSIEAIGYKFSYGIRNGMASGQDVKMNVTFADGGKIIATSAWESSDVYGIYAQGKETTVSNLSSIEANGGNTVNGIYSCTSVGQVANVSFSGAGSYINATGTKSFVYGIGAAEKGKLYVTNLGGITAKVNGNSTAYGISSKSNSGEGAENFDNNVSFVTTGGYVNASSAGGDAYGIYAYNYGKTTVTNVGSIEANSSGTEKKAYGIYGCGSNASFANNVSFASGGYVNATSAGGGAYGIGAFGNGTTTVSNVGGITAKSSSTFAFGIESYGSDAGFSNNVSFASGGTINATGTGGQAAGIFAHNDGKTYVSNLGGITAAAETNTNEVYGIKSSGRNGFVNNVSFVTTGGYINATNSKDSARGIHAQNYGTTTVTNVGDITVNGGKRAYGIYSGGSDKNFSNNVSFANGGTITATATGDNAYGMYSNGTGKTYVSNLGGITAETKASGYYAYGIYTNGTDANFSNNVSFKGNGGQAITAKATDEANAYSIYAFGNGATTVNFEDSILSGKIHQQGDATVTLNFGSNSSWTPAMGDVSGNVNVNMNSGSTLDTRVATRVATGVATNKTINLGGGSFNASAGSTISFDAKTEPIGLTTDQIKAASGSGTIELGTVNVTDSATSAWTTAKNANLFVDSDSKAIVGIAINGTTTTTTDNGFIYTFTGGTSGNVSATSEATGYTLPQVIQANPQEAGEADAFSFDKGDIKLKEDLGTLNNQYRTSYKPEFTIYGNDNTLYANGKGGVTINAGDTMTVKELTAKDFGQFATNAGTLNLDGVTFTDTTGTADVTNSGTLNLDGTNTFVKGIAGNGTTNVNADTDMGSTTLEQGETNVAAEKTLTVAAANLKSNVKNSGTVKLGAGTLGDYNIEGGKIETAGDITANVANLLADDIYNADYLTLTGTGTLNENVWDKGGVKGTVKMNAEEITIAERKTIENNIEYLGTGATNVELKDGSTIAGTVKAPEGSKIIVDGNSLKNEADQTLDVVVKETKDLTTTKKLAGNITLEDDAELTATASGAKLGNGSATNISVGKNAKLTALATNINADIYNASDKSVHLTGGTLSKNIREGGTTYIEGDTTFANGITVENKVYVDNGKSLSAENAFTLANTLYFEGGDKQSTVSNVSTTGTLGFVLTGDNKTSAIVNGNGYNVTGAKVALYQEDVALYDRLDVVKLMTGATGSYANQLIKAQDENSVVLKHKYSTYLQGNELLAKYLGSGATEEAKSFSEGRLAGVATLTQSSDLLAGAGMASAVAAAKASANGAAPFVEISGARGRYDTGSHVDLNSLNVVAGIAQKFNDNITAGAYVEGGNGRYASYNEFATGDVRGDGDVNYFGAGVFGRYDFNKTDKGNAYIDGAVGAGYTNQDYHTDSELLDSARYDASAKYAKAHATIGYEWKLSNGSIDGYAKYLWLCQGGDTVTVSTEDPISFNRINSNRLRAGFRYTHGIKNTLAWYGGLAYEYEFSAKAKASSYGFAIGEPDLIGSSGMAELGLKYAPLNGHGWRFDAGLQGFLGKRDSLGLRLGAWYEF